LVQNTLGVVSGLRTRVLKRGRSSAPTWTAVAVHHGKVHDCLGVAGGVRRWKGRLEPAATVWLKSHARFGRGRYGENVVAHVALIVAAAVVDLVGAAAVTLFLGGKRHGQQLRGCG